MLATLDKNLFRFIDKTIVDEADLHLFCVPYVHTLHTNKIQIIAFRQNDIESSHCSVKTLTYALNLLLTERSESHKIRVTT